MFDEFRFGICSACLRYGPPSPVLVVPDRFESGKLQIVCEALFRRLSAYPISVDGWEVNISIVQSKKILPHTNTETRNMVKICLCFVGLQQRLITQRYSDEIREVTPVIICLYSSKFH